MTSRQKQTSDVDFDTWRKKVELRFSADQTSRETFDRWFKPTYGTTKKQLLEHAYRKTHYALKSEEDRQKHQKAVEQLGKLQPRLQDAIEAMRAVHSVIESKDGKVRFRASSLRRCLEEAERMVSVVMDKEIGILGKRKMHRPDPLTYCLPLLVELQDSGITESKAVALCKMFMQCHGFPAGQLTSFSRNAIDSGRIRRSKENWKKVHNLEVATRS